MAALRRALRWIAWSIPAMPAAVLPHEFGHVIFMKLFGLPNVRLHFGWTSNDLAQKFVSALRRGDGILVSYLTIALCIYLVRTRPAHPFVAALGLVSTLRFELGPQIVYDHVVHGARYISGTDEGLVAATTGLPEVLVWMIGLTLVAAA
jgi:hypothetical protein